MGFKECYLVPKELYDQQVKMNDRPPLPADVKLKLLDQQKRFQTGVQPRKEDDESRLEQQMQTILNGIPDVTRKNLASQILTFIVSKGGGTIKWSDDFGVLLDNQRLYNLDIRQVLRHLVGVSPDLRRESLQIYERLLALGMKPTLLMFYNDEPEEVEDELSTSTKEDDWDDDDKYEEASPEWSPIDTSETKTTEAEPHRDRAKYLRERTHSMDLRRDRTPKWRTYKF